VIGDITPVLMKITIKRGSIGTNDDSNEMNGKETYDCKK